MKSLSLAKPLILIVIGTPGSGKSFFARQFSETFSAPEVNYDRLHHTLSSTSDSTVVNQVAEFEIDELLKTQKTFIIDGAGYSRAQRVALRKKAQESGYDTLLVWVQTDENTAKYRSMKRSSRRKDDQYNTSLTSQQYDALVKKFNPPAVNEQSVVISGKHTYATQAKVVLKKLVSSRAEARPIVNHGDRAPDANPPRRNVIIR
jgi:predicted kinase